MSDRKYPEKLMLRDTGQYDDLGGAGQRIFTTAGQGYDKMAYICEDIVSIKNRKLAEKDKRIKELEAIEKAAIRISSELDDNCVHQQTINALNQALNTPDNQQESE